MRSSCENTSQSLAGWRTVQLLVFNCGGELFQDDGPAAEKLREPKPTALVLGVTMSPRIYGLHDDDGLKLPTVT